MPSHFGIFHARARNVAKPRPCRGRTGVRRDWGFFFGFFLVLISNSTSFPHTPQPRRSLEFSRRNTMADDEEQPQHDWAGPKGLRLATVASFVPAFPLCLAHGITSGAVVPAVGLVPLAASAGIGIALLTGRAQALHPSGIFAAAFVQAGSLMVVLVFTWIIEPRGRDAGRAMLASYATMPLIANLFGGGADPRPGETYYGMRVANHLSAACSLIHFFFVSCAVFFGFVFVCLVLWLAWL